MNGGGIYIGAAGGELYGLFEPIKQRGSLSFMVHDIKETRILLADNLTEIMNMREQLREFGFNSFAEVFNGLQALTTIKKYKPGVIIANLSLPKYSGLQILNSVKADPSLAKIKFIMTTAKLNRREMTELAKDGVTNTLQRPFTAEQLKEKLFELFGLSPEDLVNAAAELAGEARKLFDEERYDEALKLYFKAVESHPLPDYYFMLARCYQQTGLLDQAIASFKNAVDKDHKHPEARSYLEKAKKKRDERNRLTALEAKATMENSTADDHVGLGKAYLNDEKVEKANSAFIRAVEKEPDNMEVRTQIGNAYLDSGLDGKAEEIFKEAIDIQPDSIHLYNRMAIALRKQNKHTDAIDLYVKALAIAPKDEGLYYNLARALAESGQKQKALKALNKALLIDPEFAEAKKLKEEYQSGNTEVVK